MKGTSKEVLLTFDVEGPPQREDFITEEIIATLYNVLKLLKKYDLKGFFFITGSGSEKISRYPKILKLLRAHEIGYHSSSHSIKPGIFEYTDIKSYEEAFEISKERETSCIDPFSGNIRGKGGILSLKQIFPEKKIDSFRAPFLCWSPCHLEALRALGFGFDFSTDISNVPIFHKGITFFPYPVLIDSISSEFYIILKKTLVEGKKVTVFVMHPSLIIFKPWKTTCRWYRNPFYPIQIKKHTRTLSRIKLSQLELFFSWLYLLRKNELIELKDSLKEAEKHLNPKKVDIAKVYERSLGAPKRLFCYKPKFLRSHFHQFFDT